MAAATHAVLAHAVLACSTFTHSMKLEAAYILTGMRPHSFTQNNLYGLW